jgi:hypothetical protein
MKDEELKLEEIEVCHILGAHCHICLEPHHQVGHLDMVWDMTANDVIVFFIDLYTLSNLLCCSEENLS